MRKRLMASVVVGLVGLVVAGCGGDEQPDAPAEGTAPLSEEEFLERANEICQEGQAEIDQAGVEAFEGEQPTPQAQERFLTETVVPGARSQIEEIRALDAPDDLQPEVDELTTEAQQALDQLENRGPEVLEGQDNPFREADRIARDIGLVACAG